MNQAGYEQVVTNLAKIWVNKALSLEPKHVGDYLTRGFILLKLERREEAMHDFQQFLASPDAGSLRDEFAPMARAILRIHDEEFNQRFSELHGPLLGHCNVPFEILFSVAPIRAPSTHMTCSWTTQK